MFFKLKLLSLVLFFMIILPCISFTQVDCPDDSKNPYKITTCQNSSCGGQIVFNVEHTITENNHECSEYFVNYNINIYEGQECIYKIKRVRLYSGNKYKPYELGETMSFVPDEGGEIALDFYLETICGDLTHVHHSCNAQVSSNYCEGCGNTFNYCKFYEPQIYWRTVCEDVVDPETGEITVECHDEYYNTTPLLQFVIFDYPDGTWEVLNSNNTYGIFNFPYYMYSSDTCSYPTSLNSFVNDINEFLDLAQTGSDLFQYFHGHCSLLEYNDPGMCKTYIIFENMGIFIESMGGTNYAREGCDFIVDDQGEYITSAFIHGHELDFPCSSECILEPVEGIPPGNLCWVSDGMISGDENIDFDNYIKQKKSFLNEFDFECYPSNAKNEIFIKINNNSDNNDINFNAEILNVHAQKVIPVSVNGDFTNIDVSMLKNGFYFVKLVDLTTGKTKIKKFIKQ